MLRQYIAHDIRSLRDMQPKNRMKWEEIDELASKKDRYIVTKKTREEGGDEERRRRLSKSVCV